MSRLVSTVLISLLFLTLPALLPKECGFLSSPLRAGGGAFLSLRQDVVTLGQEKPTVVFVPDDDVQLVTLTLTRADGWSKVLTGGPVAAGTEKAFSWDQGEGQFTYDVKAKAKFRDATTWEGENSFTITVAGTLKGDIPVDSVDLATRAFTFRASRPLSRVEVTVISEDLSEVAKGTEKNEGGSKEAKVHWPETSERILKIVARGYDAWNFWTEAEINVWSLEIPHEEVNFPTNSYQVLAEEAPKLDKAYAEIQKAVEKYGDLMQVRLFIAGYTDTVGDPGKNQPLSENRARAIASYFKSKGFRFSIFYQGFGESVLATPTGDSVEMAANRRALYVLAAALPATSKDIPRQSWKRLQ